MKRKQRQEALFEYIEHIRDEEGNAVVDVDLGDGDDLYHPLSRKGDLNGEIYDYIEAQTNVVPAVIPLRIRFHGNLCEREQNQIRQIMHRHYVMKSYDIAWDLAANLKKMLILTLFGVIVLAVYLYLSFTADHVFMSEILSIVGSFSLWEAADALLLERPHLRREYRNNEQSLNEQIEFVGSDEPKAETCG